MKEGTQPTSLEVLLLGLWAFTADGMGSTPGQGTKPPSTKQNMFDMCSGPGQMLQARDQALGWQPLDRLPFQPYFP